MILDGRVQYIWRVQRCQIGAFLEIYNLTNQVNFGNATGARNSTQFLVPTVANNSRTAQLGLRVVF